MIRWPLLADSNSPASEGKAVCWDWKNTWSQKPSSNSEFSKRSFLTLQNPQVMNSETITFIANIALAVSAVIALIFGIVQVRSAARDRQERLTLEALRNFNTREFSEL